MMVNHITLTEALAMGLLDEFAAQHQIKDRLSALVTKARFEAAPPSAVRQARRMARPAAAQEAFQGSRPGARAAWQARRRVQ